MSYIDLDGAERICRIHCWKLSPKSLTLRSSSLELDIRLSTEDEDGSTGYTKATDDVVHHDQGSDHHQRTSPIPGTSGIAQHPEPESDKETNLATEVGEIEREIRKVWMDGTTQTEAWHTDTA